MSTQAALAGVSGGEVPTGAVTAGERVQRLQSLIEEVDAGPSSFAATLEGAISDSSATSAGSVTPSAIDASDTASGATGTLGGSATASAGAEQTSAASYPVTGQGAGSGSQAMGGYAGLIDQAAAQNGLEPAVLHGLIEQESGFDPNATSSAGALGLTQLMPGTAASLGVTEPLNPAQSIQGGARYLGGLVRQFDGNTSDALAAYNAGPGAVEQYGGIPPYAETQQYVTRVLANAETYRQSAGTTADQGTYGALV